MKRIKTLLVHLVSCWLITGSLTLLSRREFKVADAFVAKNPYHGKLRSSFLSRAQHLFQSKDSSIGDETRQLIEKQQKQIDELLRIVSASIQSNGTPLEISAPSQQPHSSLPPLKVMIFIDGTWLYYSLHTRDEHACPIQKKFGVGWQRTYGIDWGVLPRVIGQALQLQDAQKGWMPTSTHEQARGGRPVEIVRVSVYTSFRSDTPKTSLRYQMFQDMINAKYDVLMLETIGHNEKCVDIQLAVDMLHYATVPDAYDVAVLISGDKDFVPAMVRTRQKGRRVALASVRGYSATRAFYETPNIKDFDVVWLDDYFDQIIKRKSAAPHLMGNRPKPVLSLYTIMRVVVDFVNASGTALVSSRDVGRYIKSIAIGDRNVLTEVKEIYGGLYQFLIVSGIFVVDASGPIRNFFVGLKEKRLVEATLEEALNQGAPSDAEKQFFEAYSTSQLGNKDRYYTFTSKEMEENEPSAVARSKPDYSDLLLADLKEICRERGLKVTGKKAVLLERISADDEKRTQDSKKSRIEQYPETSEYLESLLLEYLHAKGGHSSSRDVGRYLTANKPSSQALQEQGISTALAELKNAYGSVRQFISESPRFSEEAMESGNDYEFLVRTTPG